MPARFALELRPHQDAAVVGTMVEQALTDLRARVTPLSALDPEMLVLDLLDRVLDAARPAACFAAGYALAEQFDLVGAEPDLPTAFFPEQGADPSDMFAGGALAGFPPGCYVDPQPTLEPTPAWALDRMHVPAAWAYSEQSGRPSRGKDVIVAQPDTGITPHVELVGVAFVPGFDVIDDDNDPTDPLTERGNPGHGTGTASVLVSLDSYIVTGSAPQARLMPIRTIESVVRIRQITVARAIDWAIQEGAHVVTMSLGGIPASALHRAIRRAVEADLIVLAAAGNCVRLVVWPARYDECIAVAATNAADEPWPGTCRGARSISRHRARTSTARSCPPVAPAPPTPSPKGRAPASPLPSPREWRPCGLLTTGEPTWSTLHMPAARRSRRCFADCCRPPLAGRPRGTPMPWAQGSSMRAHFSKRASTWVLVAVGALHTNARASAASSVASLVAEAVGAGAVPDDTLDWHQFGPELATTLLGRQVHSPPREGPQAKPSERLAETTRNPQLRDSLGLSNA